MVVYFARASTLGGRIIEDHDAAWWGGEGASMQFQSFNVSLESRLGYAFACACMDALARGEGVDTV